MSPKICARFYRPPEIILLEREYDQSMDMWAVGCILAELIIRSHPYRKKGYSDNKFFLFEGEKCYPMSPNDDPQL